MPKLPIVSAQQAIKVFEKAGYRVVRQKGSHIRLLHLSKKALTIPNHKELGKGLLRKLLRNTEMLISEFIRLLD
ncbi:MAG: type II toxin-antitoxin system HicA family toxin [bacterium]|nr:type II toxin-antitoxin system HicA family toxin [bacterium]